MLMLVGWVDLTPLPPLSSGGEGGKEETDLNAAIVKTDRIVGWVRYGNQFTACNEKLTNCAVTHHQPHW
ncbi:hypothetical protein ACE1CD_11915 [Aerosakkonema sp. BLCC-F183]|uniref:hypothetical protein n=1 Tax=Aerosakkonema sp. BLCC-F183 TaxID=3342834 RepID=UPI0035BACC9F